MEKTEAKKSRMNAKMLAALVAIIFCSLVVGISVFAALTQTAVISDTVSISQSGQAKVTVTVTGEKVTDATLRNAGIAGDVTAIKAVTPLDDFSQTKSATTDSASWTGLQPVFSVSNGYTYYMYKIVMTNTLTTSAASYNIAQTLNVSASPANQITVWSVTGSVATGTVYSTALTGNLGVSGGGSDTVTVYLVYALNTALASLTDMSSNAYTITITLTGV